MLRRRFDEMLEELKQQMMPPRPEIGTPVPRTIFERAPQPGWSPDGEPRREIESQPEAVGRSREAPPPRPRPVLVPRVQRQSVLRSQLSSPAQRRAAFQLIEVLGPPVSMRDPLERAWLREVSAV